MMTRRSQPPARLGLRESIAQFSLLVGVNALVGGMIGQERTVLPLLATDEFGLHAVEDRLHVHDLHATIMHLLGVDHTKLIYHQQGRPERIDVNEGRAYTKIVG